ncbi:MAG: conjugal transfer protein TraN [Novosphingobium sp.]|nr:conjugal transfer protein TraN [Novosphingobium sp.]
MARGRAGRFARLALPCLLLALASHPAQAQVYIPPPDDLVEELPVLPPDVDPVLPAPAPPPPSAPSTMTAEEAKGEARSTGAALRGAYQGLTQEAGAAGQVPGYQESYPVQTQYYTNPEALQTDGAVAGWNSEAYETANSTTRPTVDVTRSDLARATAIEADPDAYLEGMSADGSTGDCVPLPPGSGTANTAEWTCHVGSQVVEQPRTCTSSLSVNEWNDMLYQYVCVIAPGFDGCTALAGNGQCRRTATYPVPDYNLTVDYYDCDTAVSDPNAYLIAALPKPPPADAFAVVNSAYRCNAQGISDALTFDAVTGMPLQYVTGLQQCGSIAADPTCTRTSAAAAGLAERVLCKTWDFIGDPFGGGGYLTCIEPAAPEEVYLCSSNVAGMTAESAVAKWFTQAWTDSACSIDPASCTLSSQTCTAPNETRVIGGVAVTRPCWERTRTYLCQSVVGGGNDCGALETQAGCSLAREVCLDDPPAGDGSCAVSERVYACPIPGTSDEPAQYICGGDVYCVNGDCEAVEREASDEFKDAVVALNALGQANAEFDEAALTLFRGTRESCSHKVFGLSNCCSGKGVPLFTPWLCSSAEKLLDEKDDAGLCHKVGTYCSSSFLGICVTKKDVYCCFQSKISRILQEQGRPQIGKPWGKPKTETCEGFSIFEFQQLDLSVMDFSEVYADFMEAAKLPDEAAALVQIQQKIADYYAAHRP